MPSWARTTLTGVRRRLQGGFGRNVALLIGSTAIGQVAVLATLPLVGRLYTPADIGRLGAFLAFLGTVSVATALRYDIMIVAAESAQEAAALLAGVCLATVPASLVCSIGLAVLIKWRILGFGVLPLDGAFWMFPALVATQLFFSLRYWLMREGAFPVIARVTVSQNCARAIGPLIVFPVAASWVGLVSAEVLSRCVGIGAVLRARSAELRRSVAAVRWADIVRAFANYPESVYAGLPSTLINAASNYLALPLIAQHFGVVAAGYFGIVQRGMQIPAALVSRNVADVFHARLAEQGRSAPAGARQLFWRTSGMLLLVGGLPSLLVAAVGPSVFRLVLGSKWDPASGIIVAMIPWTLASFIVAPLSRAVVVFRGQVQKLIYDGVSLAAVWGVVVGGSAAGWGLEHTVWILSLTQAGTYFLYMVILVRLLPAADAHPRGGLT